MSSIRIQIHTATAAPSTRNILTKTLLALTLLLILTSSRLALYALIEARPRILSAQILASNNTFIHRNRRFLKIGLGTFWFLKDLLFLLRAVWLMICLGRILLGGCCEE